MLRIVPPGPKELEDLTSCLMINLQVYSKFKKVIKTE
jgi:hypothetical protein